MKFILTIYMSCLLANTAFSQWTPVTTLAPSASGGGMVLLSDGSVLVKDYGGGASNLYYKLTPDINGSYINGTWTTIAPMINTRLYYSTQLLKDGRVYVAGGEYGSGIGSAEIYDPLTNSWSAIPVGPGYPISDANSAILEDGRILQSLVGSPGAIGTSIYNQGTNAYSTGPACLGQHAETAWLKLPDNSELFVDLNTTNSERYIPSVGGMGSWITDGSVPVNLYSGGETGGALLLPDGRAFFIGGGSHNAFYTPSGNTTPGTWSAAADFPNSLGAIDAPAAMMVNGKVLCDASPLSSPSNPYPHPTYFFEFDPITNSFASISAPDGNSYLDIPTYYTTFLALPDGKVLFARLFSNQYYVYTPSGVPQNSWRPTINTVTPMGSNTYQITGTQFNGISEGATYGDDWQMNTNYPLVRLVNANGVYYTRTVNWNSTGVRRGTSPDQTTFTLPTGLPLGTYSLYVVANGIESLPFIFNYTCPSDITITGNYGVMVTQSDTWIKSSGVTIIRNNRDVRLDANPSIGYIELKPQISADYFLAEPITSSAVFIAHTLDGCGAGIPSFQGTEKPIINTALINGTNALPPYRSLAVETNNKVIKNTKVEIFPNPAKGSFIIKYDKITRDTKINLFDMSGKVQNIAVEKFSFNSAKVKWQNLSSGVYFLSISTDKKTDFIKVVIHE